MDAFWIGFFIFIIVLYGLFALMINIDADGLKSTLVLIKEKLIIIKDIIMAFAVLGIFILALLAAYIFVLAIGAYLFP